MASSGVEMHLRVLVVADNRGVPALAGLGVAGVSGALVLVVAHLGDKSALAVDAAVGGAGVLVVAHPGLVLALAGIALAHLAGVLVLAVTVKLAAVGDGLIYTLAAGLVATVPRAPVDIT
jgi:hypothetical protein